METRKNRKHHEDQGVTELRVKMEETLEKELQNKDNQMKRKFEEKEGEMRKKFKDLYSSQLQILTDNFQV